MLESGSALLHIRHILFLIEVAFLLHADTVLKYLIFLTLRIANRACVARVVLSNGSLILCRIEREGVVDESIVVELAASTFSSLIIIQIQILVIRTPTRWLDI